MRRHFKNQKDVPSHLIPHGLTPTQMIVLHIAINNWNDDADEHNQWDDLGGDERLELINNVIERDGIKEIDADEEDQFID